MINGGFRPLNNIMKLNELIGIKNSPITQAAKDVDDVNFADESPSEALQVIEDKLHNMGFNRINNGWRGVVFDHPNLNYVLKIFNSDDCYISFIKTVKTHNNKHFPKIIGNITKLSKKVGAIRLEKLYPVDSKYSKILTLLSKLDIGKRKELINKHLPDQIELVNAIQLVLDNNNNRCFVDLHFNNYMKRSDGTIVIIDPYSDNDTYD